jgi:small subunit ribosomal protein S20
MQAPSRGRRQEQAGDTQQMAHSKSAKKRVRQNLKRRAMNRSHISAVRTQVKKTLKDIDAGAASTEEMSKTFKALDQLAAKGRIHKNQAARRKSRLARRFNAKAAAK